MDASQLALFIPACFALNVVPGPNNLLALSNAQRLGASAAVIASSGRLAAFALMIFLAATGLAAVLYASESLFYTIKMAGALYLFWVALQLWRASAPVLGEHTDRRSTVLEQVRQEFLLAVANPKAILIFTAFLPQFVDSQSASGVQFFVLGALFLCLELVAISMYAAAGVYFAHWFASPVISRRFNRCCALVIAALGMGMALERRA